MAEHIQHILTQKTVAAEAAAASRKTNSGRDHASNKQGHSTKPNTQRKIVSAVLADGTLVETLYRRDERKTLFCVSRDGQISHGALGGIRLEHPRKPGFNVERRFSVCRFGIYGSREKLII